MLIHLLAPKYSLPKINRLSRVQIYTPDCWRLRSAMRSLTHPTTLTEFRCHKRKFSVAESCHITRSDTKSPNFLTFQHLHCHGHCLFGPVFVNPHRLGHDHLPKATFSQRFAQRQPGGANSRLTHSIWWRGAASEIPGLNIKTFHQLAAVWGVYHMEPIRAWVRVSFCVFLGMVGWASQRGTSTQLSFKLSSRLHSMASGEMQCGRAELS